MLRKTMVVLAIALALGSSPLSTTAFARSGGGAFGGVGFGADILWRLRWWSYSWRRLQGLRSPRQRFGWRIPPQKRTRLRVGPLGRILRTHDYGPMI